MRLLIASIVASTIIFTGCSNKQDNITVNPMEMYNKINDVPSWVHSSTQFQAVGSAKYIGQTYDMLNSEATLQAKANLAQKIEAEVNTLLKNYSNVANKTINSSYESTTTKTSTSLASITMRNTKVLNHYITKDGEYFIQVEIDSNGLDSILSEVRQRSEVAYQELKKEVADLKARKNVDKNITR